MKDYYKILGLPFGASLVEIKSAYRKLAFQFHPDKTAGNKIAEEKFLEITEAYKVLSNKDKLYWYQIEYKDFLQGKQKPPTITIHDYYKDPKQYPRQPIAKATKPELDKNGIIAASVIFFLIFFVVFFFREKVMIPVHVEQRETPFDLDSNHLHHLTKDEYYIMVSEDFIKTHDSTLLKIENVDSVIHVIDSLINLNRK